MAVHYSTHTYKIMQDSTSQALHYYTNVQLCALPPLPTPSRFVSMHTHAGWSRTKPDSHLHCPTWHSVGAHSLCLEGYLPAQWRLPRCPDMEHQTEEHQRLSTHRSGHCGCVLCYRRCSHGRLLPPRHGGPGVRYHSRVWHHCWVPTALPLVP